MAGTFDECVISFRSLRFAVGGGRTLVRPDVPGERVRYFEKLERIQNDSRNDFNGFYYPCTRSVLFFVFFVFFFLYEIRRVRLRREARKPKQIKR